MGIPEQPLLPFKLKRFHFFPEIEFSLF